MAKKILESKSWRLKKTLYLFVLTFASLGTYLLMSGHAATPSGGVCSPNPCTPGAFKAYTVVVDDGAGKSINLNFQLERPNNLVNSASNKVPVVVTFANNQDWVTQSAAGKFIVVYIPQSHPSGTGSQYAAMTVANSGVTGFPTCGPSGTALCDDVPGVQTLIQDLESCSTVHHLNAPCQNVDSQSIYATGGSKGGTMTEAVACDPRTSGLFTAVAPISTLIISYHNPSPNPNPANKQTWGNCPSLFGYDERNNTNVPINHNVSILWVYGDLESPFTSNTCAKSCVGPGFLNNGNSWDWGDDQMIKTLIGPAMGCAGIPTDTVLASGKVSGVAGQAIQHLYAPCSATARALGTIEVTNGPHVPEGSTADGVTFAPVIWNFFASYSGNAATTPVPTVSFSASPVTVASGKSSSLNWSSTNATACTASGGWSGSKPTAGTQVVTPTSSVSFSLSCSGPGGSNTASTSVTVTNTPPPPTPPTVSLAATPVTINKGNSTTLAWNSTNTSGTTPCTASGGWSGSKPAAGSFTTTALQVSTNYALTCNGPGGSTLASRTVNVTNSPVTPSPEPLSLGSDSSGTPPPVVSGNVSLNTGSIPVKKVSYSIDGKTVNSATINTRALNDGKHTIQAVITEPDGKVVTVKRTIQVNNHQPVWRNVMLKYGKPATFSFCLGLAFVLVVVPLWLFYLRQRPQLVEQLLLETDDVLHHPSHLYHRPIQAADPPSVTTQQDDLNQIPSAGLSIPAPGTSITPSDEHKSD